MSHSFWSSLRDWCDEFSTAPREVTETALTHVIRTKVDASYVRSNLFKRERGPMDDWAAYLARALTAPGHCFERGFERVCSRDSVRLYVVSTKKYMKYL